LDRSSTSQASTPCAAHRSFLQGDGQITQFTTIYPQPLPPLHYRLRHPSKRLREPHRHRPDQCLVKSTLVAGPLPNVHPLTAITKTSTSNTVWADVIQVQWQSSDKKIISLLSQTNSAMVPSSKASKAVASKTPAVALSTSTAILDSGTESSSCGSPQAQRQE